MGDYRRFNKGPVFIDNLMVCDYLGKQVLIADDEYWHLLINGYKIGEEDVKATMILKKYSFGSMKALRRFIRKRGILSLKDSIEVAIGTWNDCPFTININTKRPSKLRQFGYITRKKYDYLPFDTNIPILKNAVVCMTEQYYKDIAVLLNIDGVLINIAYSTEDETYTLYYDHVKTFTKPFGMTDLPDCGKDMNEEIKECIKLANEESKEYGYIER